MRKLSSFLFLSLDGYYKDPNDDISWHDHGEGESEFSAQNLKSGNVLLFGRKTFELMAAFWPTDMASKQYPEVAAGMNRAEKIVLSTTLEQPTWQITTVYSEHAIEEIRKLKSTPGNDITVLGSGDVLRQLTDAGLVDEFQVMVDPIVLGKGSAFLSGIRRPLRLTLMHTRIFDSGAVLHHYRNAAAPSL